MQSDAELVQAVRSGDRDAYTPLVLRYERVAWATAWRILNNHHAAADAAQEAFLQAYRRLDSLRDPALFGVWLLQITRREAVRLAQRRRRQATRPLDEAVSYPSRAGPPAGSLSSESEALLAAVAGLPDHERLVVTLRYLDNQSVAAIAAISGRPIGTVTKQLSRAVERLRSMLKEVIS
jgi:RNA polymerase sigma-70 factor (ECF subfamily)